MSSTATPVSTSLAATLVCSATPPSTARATPQGGVIEGANPSSFDPKNPITVFIIQAGIIIIFCRLLHFPLSRLRQPRVIAEVIGGIVLGPSVMGHVPHFSDAIFPPASMPGLTLVANLGLVLFLFLVGLEVDLRFLVSNWRVALSVGALGMALPFSMGIAISYGLYNQFANEPGTKPISFGVFLLFIGVAMAITAFPVLCRILTELKLLNTPVGVIVLSAGVGNDVVGWILLALCVALVNAGTGITALYVLLVALGYTIFLVYAVRPAFLWILRRSGSLQNGPTQSVIALTLLMVLVSAFFTQIIGVHAIFGGFMIGIICPHDGGFAIKVTEKVEDLVGVLFLPLYFALSGLNTNLGLLNTGITWAYVVGVVAVAFIAKVIGGTLAARLNGLVWRESFTIGALMSCKGLVELIVLNIGLQAQILSTRTFTIFVVMALVTTFATTPLVSALYPHWYQVKLEAWKRGEIDWDGNRLQGDGNTTERDSIAFAKPETASVTKLLMYLRLDNMSGILAFIPLLAPPKPSATADKVHPAKQTAAAKDLPGFDATVAKIPLYVHGIRMTELTDRDSSVMKVSEMDEFTMRDPVVNTFRTFGQLTNLAVAGAVVVAPEASYASTLTDRATEIAAQLLMVPWSDTGYMSENTATLIESTSTRFSNGSFSHFVTSVLKRAPCNVAVFIDNGFGGRRPKHLRPLTRTISAMSARDMNSIPVMPVISNHHHIFFPYFGSEDDHAALRLVLQLARAPSVTATIVHFELSVPVHDGVPPANLWDAAAGANTNARLTTADYASASRSREIFTAMRESLAPDLNARVLFESVPCSDPIGDTVARAVAEAGSAGGSLVVLGRNATVFSLLARPQPSAEGAHTMAEEARWCFGAVGPDVVASGINASLLIVQARASDSAQ